MRRQRSPENNIQSNKQIIINTDDDSQDDDDDSCLIVGATQARQSKPLPPHRIMPRSVVMLRPPPSNLPLPNHSNNNNAANYFLRTPLDAKDHAKGWIIHSKIPPHLQIADKEKGFNHLLKNRIPKVHGQVQILGKMVDVPRFQKAYLSDYVFTGAVSCANEDEDPLDPVCLELMEWCNEQLHHLQSNEEDEEQKERKNKNTNIDEHVVGWLPSREDFKLVASVCPGNKNKEGGLATKKYFFNSALLNWYLDGEHYVGPHADDETCMFDLSPVFSLSLGQTRTFRIRDKFTNEIIRDIELRNLDFVVMGGAMQRFYKHEIVKISGAKAKMLFGPRVNVTFRCFTNPVMRNLAK